MIVETKLEEPWLGVFQGGVQQIRQLDAAIVQAKATIHDAQQEQAATRKTLGVLVGALPDVLGLPPSVTGYRLSEDGTALIGETGANADSKVTVEDVQDDVKE